MFFDKTVLAIITARGGSKGIPGKNIKLLCGKPLIAWTIEAAIKSKYIDRTIVSTDSDEIMKVSREWGAEVPFKRPVELATDEASSESVILHALNWIQDNDNKYYDYFILLQPTSPLRNEQHIDGAIEKIIEDQKAESLVSISEVSISPYLMKVVNRNGYLDDFIKQDNRVSRRQDLPRIYQINGAIYISKMEDYLEKKSFYMGNNAYYLMDVVSSLDIDTYLDFQIAQVLISQQNFSLK